MLPEAPCDTSDGSPKFLFETTLGEGHADWRNPTGWLIGRIPCVSGDCPMPPGKPAIGRNVGSFGVVNGPRFPGRLSGSIGWDGGGFACFPLPIAGVSDFA
jgi:hypothetical protein